MSPREGGAGLLAVCQLCSGRMCVVLVVCARELRMMQDMMLASRVQRRGPVGLNWAGMGQCSTPSTFLPLPLSSQASGDTPTTPKHPKESRENFFPATVVPTAPDGLQRPSESHLKPVLATVIACPPSASASAPDLCTDPGTPRPHKPEATHSRAPLSPGKCHLSPSGNLGF